MGCKQEDFICSLDNFASLPPLTKNFYIPTDVISNALNACGFPKQRHKFAINLFRHVCTIGEAHGRNVTGKSYQPGVIKDRICPTKIEAIYSLCCEYFPSNPGEEDGDWRTIVSALHKAIWAVEKFIQNFLDISPIAGLQNEYS